MNFRKLMYVVIAIICISAIAIGVYDEIGMQNKTKTKANVQTNTTSSEQYTGKTQEELKQDFNSIFDNKVHIGQYDTTNISKTDATKDVVYTFYSLKEKQGNYDVDLNFPIININTEAASKFNDSTQSIFANKANEILQSAKQDTIYTVTYTGYVNGDIMSVIIKSNLKEGTSAQRVMVQTYNYNLKTGKEVKINDAISQRGVSEEEVSQKINEQVKEAIKESNDIQVTGYEVYTRNIDNKMYKLENTETYFLDGDGALYIIYAYGNSEFTSEMDIIVI